MFAVRKMLASFSLISSLTVKLVKYSLRILASFRSLFTTSPFSMGLINGKTCILSLKTGLTVFQNFLLSAKFWASGFL